MKNQLKGIIIREADYGENDKIINILTDKEGIISAVVRKAKNIKHSKGSIVQSFSYCNFSLYVGKNGYIVDDFEILELFWNIRNDLYNLSLAQYFSQLCFAFSPDSNNSGELLRLFLNILFYIAKGEKSLAVLKVIFEMRGCAICGYMPNLIGCVCCKSYSCEDIYFSVGDGVLMCGECLQKLKQEQHRNFVGYKLSTAVFKALRYIVYSEFDKLFGFNISASFEKELEYISEKYIYYHIGSGFKALDFYKSLF